MFLRIPPSCYDNNKFPISHNPHQPPNTMDKNPRHLRFALSLSLNHSIRKLVVITQPAVRRFLGSVGVARITGGGGSEESLAGSRLGVESSRIRGREYLLRFHEFTPRGADGKLVKCALPLKFDDREGGAPTANDSYLKPPMHTGRTRAVQIYRAGESAKPATPPLFARQQVDGRIASLIVESPVIQYMNRLGRFVFNRRRESPRKK